MLPAPTTIAISMPNSWRSAISAAMRSTSWRSRPYSMSPMSASPDSFNRTRRKAGLPAGSARKGVALVLEDFELMLLERLGNRLACVVDPLLVGQHGLAEEPLRKHPLDDLLAMFLGTGLHLRELFEDLALRGEVLVGDLAAVRVQRRGEGDVHRQQPSNLGGPLRSDEDADLVRGRMDIGGERLVVVLLLETRRLDGDVLAKFGDKLLPLVVEPFDCFGTVPLDCREHLLCEGLELLMLPYLLALAADADERAHLLVDQRQDDALGRLAARTLACLRHPALAQELLRGVDVAFGLLQRPLGVHHPRAGLVAEQLDECRRDLSHRFAPPRPRSRPRFPPVPSARARPASRPPRAPARARPPARARASLRAGRSWPQQPRTPPAAPGPCRRRSRRRSRGSRGCRSESHRRCQGSRSRPRPDRSWCRRDR